MPSRIRGYRLSPLAIADLEEIWLYTFRQWSLEQADQYHHDLITTIEALAGGRKIGRPADIRQGYFKCAVGRHFIFYRQSDSALDVIRILHQRMDVERHL